MVPLAKAANKNQSEEEPSKSKLLSSFWSPLLYMLIEKWPNSHTLAILTSINFH